MPVIRNAEGMSFLDIERKLAELSAKARDSSISIEDMTGGTFTISNGGAFSPNPFRSHCFFSALLSPYHYLFNRYLRKGVFGSLMGTPIINPPQAAILGMHAVNDRPVAINGQVLYKLFCIIFSSFLSQPMLLNASNTNSSTGGHPSHDVRCPDVRPPPY